MSTTIYDHISKNNRNTFLITLLFPVTLIVMISIAIFLAIIITEDSYLIEQGLIMAKSFHLDFFTFSHQNINPYKVFITSTLGYTLAISTPLIIISFVWIMISYFFGSQMILGASRAVGIQKKDNPEVYRLVENVAIAAGLPMPKVYIIDDNSLNAFATGRDPAHASVTLTKGIIDKLNRQELEGVIAHEMAHIGNRDIRLMLIIITGVGIISLLSDILFRVTHSFSSNNNKNNGAIVLLFFFVAIAMTLFSLIIAPLLRFALSRSQEYAADTVSAMITRNPGALANALEKIASDSRVEVLDNMPTVGALCIANPLGDGHKRFIDFLSGLYSTHPPIQKRIAALREMDSF